METLHPHEIELGLARVRAVQQRMDLTNLPFPVITVGGTNGKGSTVTMLEAILHAAGYKVAAYTSPHLLRYNERVRVGGDIASDDDLCAAFARVEAARGDTPLTYFEFGTLAAVDLMRTANIDIAVLEVGLGGRLDAVNGWDADVAVVTSIGIDHTDWLGPDRESIGREKAGIFRARRCAVCGDPQPPASLLEVARTLGAELYCVGRDFHFERTPTSWNWHGPRGARRALPAPALRGDYQLYNAASVLMALECLDARVPVTQAHVRDGLLGAVLPGRFQTLPGTPLRVLDVAHNAQAAQALAHTLAAQAVSGRTYAVVGMLKDKPIGDVFAALLPQVDAWFLGGLSETARGAPALQLQDALRTLDTNVPATTYTDIASAYAAALAHAHAQDRIVVFGSFYTVGAILRTLHSETRA